MSFYMTNKRGILAYFECFGKNYVKDFVRRIINLREFIHSFFDTIEGDLTELIITAEIEKNFDEPRNCWFCDLPFPKKGEGITDKVTDHCQ